VDDFEEIYTRYFTDVYYYARRLTGNNDAAEELTAETFLKALKAIDHYDERGNLRVWLCQIAKHTWYNQWRHKKREVPLGEDFAHASGSVNFPQALEDSDTALRLHALLHRMEEPYKEVFYLRVFCEQSHAQIAALFGKSESWARVTYHRAKAKLLQELEGDAHGKP
jgi:RNA polymerase sigma-70 factor (ECF subfamily)